ncbi:TRAM domain-containing protein [Candidatus Woesearchaeota archaeon]|nr:TRAM domain-containing protein [Candidatus Woesearchaeota archaeon]
MYGSGRSRGGYGGGRGGGDRFPPKAPFNIGDEFEVTVESVGEKGDGVAKKNGFVLFVPNTKQGDTVKVRVTKLFKKFAFAEVVGAGQPSESSEASEAPEASEEQSEKPEASEESDDYEEDTSEESTEDSEDFGEDDS